MKTRTLLIDSNYLLKRSVNGAKNVTTNSFGAIGGLYSFLTTTRKLIREHKINKVVLVWDGENGGIHRYQLDPAYKSKRKNKSWNKKIQLSDYEYKRELEKEESLLKQKKRIQAYAEELFLRQIEVDDIEGDDIIAAYCVDYNNKEEIYLYTNDRDFSQLLDLNITIIFGNIDTPITRANYFHYFGHIYSNALIIKIICGDTSDSIAGVKGLKETGLLNYFPEIKYEKLTVKEVCGRAKKFNEKRISNKQKPIKAIENLLDSVERFKLNYILINLRKPFLNEVAIDELEQLEMPLSPQGRGSKNLYKMMLEDEFLTIYKSTFVNYIEPFYPVIINEKQALKIYEKKKRRL